MDINAKFPTSSGYPTHKAYIEGHWYGPFHEFEWSGEASAESYMEFFDELIAYNNDQFLEKVEKKREGESTTSSTQKEYRKAYQIRFLMTATAYNASFLGGLRYFFSHILSFVEPTFILFGDQKKELIELLKNWEVSYKELPIEDAQIEKIEWYWNGMHPDASPNVRFDKATGQCVMFGRAISSPLYPNYQEAMSKWFDDYLKANQEEGGKITVDMFFDYFDSIDHEFDVWTKLLETQFGTDKISFTWYFDEEEIEDEEELAEALQGFFGPFESTHQVLPQDDFYALGTTRFKRFTAV